MYFYLEYITGIDYLYLSRKGVVPDKMQLIDLDRLGAPLVIFQQWMVLVGVFALFALPERLSHSTKRRLLFGRTFRCV